jgi:hypothetical protein
MPPEESLSLNWLTRDRCRAFVYAMTGPFWALTAGCLLVTLVMMTVLALASPSPIDGCLQGEGFPQPLVPRGDVLASLPFDYMDALCTLA